MPSVLVTGGSGYLGQFVVRDLVATGYWQVGYTYCSTSAPQKLPPNVCAFQVNLATGAGLQEALTALGAVSAVVNCAAISQPAVCERSPDTARSVNVPTALLSALHGQRERTGCEAVLVHLSTDQVYSGIKPYWKESDAAAPVNTYGTSKAEAEEAIKASWPRSVILRSSIIYGPHPPVPVQRGLFLQFMDNALGAGEKTVFFDDEFRSPIYVADLVAIIRACIESQSESPQAEVRVYNAGGPQRMSRVDMAVTLADARGYDRSAILPGPAASVNRGVASPADISMDVSLLQEELGIRVRTFREALGDMGMIAS